MYKKDRFEAGILITLIETILAFLLICVVVNLQQSRDLFVLQDLGKPVVLSIVPGCINVWYYFKKNKEKSGRGALLTIFVSLILLMLLFN